MVAFCIIMRIRRPLFAALLLAAGPVAAQPWVGLAGIGVRVTNQSGAPLAGAEVRLFYLGDRLRGGPTPLLTDAEGRVEIGGLAEGLWFARVRHPDYMAYEAELLVEDGKKPREGMVARRKEGDSVAMNRVRFYRVEGMAGRGAPRPAPRTTPPAASAPSPPSRAPSPPETAETVTPDRPVAAVPAADERSPFARFLRNPREGTCFDCRPGEWAVFAESAAHPAPADATGCPDLRPLAEALLPALGRLGGYAGPLFDRETDRPWELLLGAELAARIADLVTPHVAADSGCQVVALRLPAGARFVGFQLEALDSTGPVRRDPVPCLPGEDCPGGGGRWSQAPVVERGEAESLVLAGFERRTSSTPRRGRLTVYFVPRSDWRPAR